jgi:lipoprotein NlpD
VPPGTVTEPRGDKRPYSDEALAQAQGKPAAPAAKPAEKPAEPKPAAVSDDVAWGWPATGKLIGQFSETGANKGIDIAAKVGDPVIAAGPGKVVYSGQGLRGYGRLVIIKHNNTYLSAYAHNSNLLVKEGQAVTKGQKIAEAGNTDSDVPKLHFEIRRQGKPIDPIKLLPER